MPEFSPPLDLAEIYPDSAPFPDGSASLQQMRMGLSPVGGSWPWVGHGQVFHGSVEEMRVLATTWHNEGQRYMMFQEPSAYEGEPLADVPFNAAILVPEYGASARRKAERESQLLVQAGVGDIGTALALGRRGLRRVLDAVDNPAARPHDTHHSVVRGLRRLKLELPLRAAIDLYEDPVVDADALARIFPDPNSASVVVGFTFFARGSGPKNYQALQVNPDAHSGILTIRDLKTYAQSRATLEPVVGYRPLTHIIRLRNKLADVVRQASDARALAGVWPQSESEPEA